MTNLSPEILERISDAFVALDSGWRYVYVNAKAGDLFGRTPASLVGKHIWTEFPEGVGQPFHSAYERAMRDQVPIILEEYYEPWGRWFENRIYPSHDGLSIFFTDITERKLVLATIGESEHRFRTLFEESPAGVFLFDRGLRITDCNARFVDLLRTSRGRLRDFNMQSVKDRRILPAIKAALRGEESFYEGLYEATTSEAIIWISMRVRPLRDASGDIQGGIGVVEDITDRKRLEAQYIAAEAHYRRLVQTSPYGIYALDTEGYFTEINKAGADLLGRPASDVLGRSFSEVVAPEDVPRLHSAIRQRQSPNEADVYEMEFQALLPSGERRLLHVRAAAIREGDRILGTHGVARDVSEERAAERAQHESEMRFRQLTENIPGAFWMTSADHAQKLYLSPAYEEIFGIPLEEVYKKPQVYLELIHPEDRLRVMAAFSAHPEEPVSVEYRIVRRDGQMRWILDRAFPVLDTNGSIYRVAGVAEDVTRRREVEDARRAAEAHYRRLVTTSPYAVYVLDQQGHFTEVNPAAGELLARQQHEILGRHFSEMLPERRDVDLASEMFSRIISGGAQTVEFPIRIVRPSGEVREIELTATAILRDGQSIGMHGIARDVTEQRQLEAQLRQASKMEAVGQLAGGVAHDFNNMLMVISGFAALLEGRIEGGSEAALYVQEIRKAAHRSADLTRQLLAFGRRQMLRPAVLELNAIVESAGSMLRRLIPATIAIETKLAADPGRVRVDPTQLEQVLVNLVVNARDAMSGGGTLTVETRNRRITEGDLRTHPFLATGEYISLMVRDTGHGMDAGTLLRIFEPFFTSKPQGEGTGLGLATVYGIVKQSGGYIWAESQPGLGSNFTVLLPSVDDAAPAAPAMKQHPTPAGSGTILLAEDEAALRALIRVALQEGGYTILTAENGEEALRVAREHGAPVDLLLCDVVMPRVGGKELAERLRESDPGLPVIFMSGYAGDILPEGGTLPRGTSFVQKPVDPDLLAALVAAALRDCDVP
jgi:PAS domain S-box-containing protein